MLSCVSLLRDISMHVTEFETWLLDVVFATLELHLWHFYVLHLWLLTFGKGPGRLYSELFLLFTGDSARTVSCPKCWKCPKRQYIKKMNWTSRTWTCLSSHSATLFDILFRKFCTLSVCFQTGHEAAEIASITTRLSTDRHFNVFLRQHLKILKILPRYGEVVSLVL